MFRSVLRLKTQDSFVYACCRKRPSFAEIVKSGYWSLRLWCQGLGPLLKPSFCCVFGHDTPSDPFFYFKMHLLLCCSFSSSESYKKVPGLRSFKWMSSIWARTSSESPASPSKASRFSFNWSRLVAPMITCLHA